MTSLIAILLTLLVLCTGCFTTHAQKSDGPSVNAFNAGSRLPQSVRRVVVLPLTVDPSMNVDDDRDALQPVLLSEISKAAAFETIVISPEQLRALTGSEEWNAQDPLPADLLPQLRAATHCDAVLFCRLTQLRAYPPMAVGWNLKLIDLNKRAVLWSVDQVLDAGQPAVAQAAREYYVRATSVPAPKGDPNSVLLSPRLFGQYASAAVVGTIPTH